jgi:hypothetical protein
LLHATVKKSKLNDDILEGVKVGVVSGAVITDTCNRIDCNIEWGRTSVLGPGSASFCRSVEKNRFFSMEKTVLTNTVFAGGKNFF